MKTSSNRILTTHVGSLPRPADVADLLLRREHGEPVDDDQFESVLATAVRMAVEKQAAAGIDIISDGELSKIGYATYIKDRLSGFSGNRPRKPALDLQPYPEYMEKMALVAGKQNFKRLCCTGPIKVLTTEPLEFDLANFRAALAGITVSDAFINAASPGVVSAFQPNEYYPSQNDYLQAIAAAMQGEYEAIVAAGFILQVDCPDLAMARHTGFQDLTEKEFLAQAVRQVEALNSALGNIPADKIRMHVCWGNYEGPHTHDVPLETILPVVLKAKPSMLLIEAANPRHEHEWEVWTRQELPDDKVLVPGVIDTSTNYVEHPELVAQRIARFANIVGRERVMAGT